MTALHPFYKHPLYGGVKNESVQLTFAYLATGVIVTAADFATFSLFFTFLQAGLLAATCGAYGVGLIVSYLLNRFWVFRKGAQRQATTTSLVRYAIFLALNLLITYGMLWVMEYMLGITPYIGKFVVNFFMIFWIYWGNMYWVFAGPRMGPIKL